MQVQWEQRDRLSYGWYHGYPGEDCEYGQYLNPEHVEQIEVVPKVTAAYVSGRCGVAVETRPGLVAPCGLERGHDGAHKPIEYRPAARKRGRLIDVYRQLRREYGFGRFAALIALLDWL